MEVLVSLDNMGPVTREEVATRLQQCKAAEDATLFVIFKSMNKNCVIYKKKSGDDGKLSGVDVEWLM